MSERFVSNIRKLEGLAENKSVWPVHSEPERVPSSVSIRNVDKAPRGVDAAKTAKCLRIAERERGVASNEVVSASAAGASRNIQY